MRVSAPQPPSSETEARMPSSVIGLAEGPRMIVSSPEPMSADPMGSLIDRTLSVSAPSSRNTLIEATDDSAHRATVGLSLVQKPVSLIVCASVNRTSVPSDLDRQVIDVGGSGGVGHDRPGGT